MIVLFLVSAITFLLVNLAPGGPSSLMRMDITAEQREALSRRLGLDQPVPVRYAQWLGGAVHGDLGTSLSSNEPVAIRIAQRLPNTLHPGRRRAGPLDRWSAFRWACSRALRRNSLPDFLSAADQRPGPVDPGLLAGHHPDPGLLGESELAALVGYDLTATKASRSTDCST